MTTTNRVITIDPVTRIEGHARVILDLDDAREVTEARLVVNELRGFERILVGMEADRMPLITARICGVCPGAHHLAASKALDAAAGVDPPPAAKLLRELLHMGHYIHSHTLSLFVLAGPDLVLGLDGDPATRNIVGVVAAVPEVAKTALRLRTVGQRTCETVGGRGTHPVTSLAGGIAFLFSADNEAQLRAWADEATALVASLAGTAKELLLRLVDAHPAMSSSWVLPAWSLGTVKDGRVNLYDGLLRQVDETGAIRGEWPCAEYDTKLRERVLDWSYMKPVFLLHEDEEHVCQVGALARLNCADGMATPLAEAELGEWKKRFGWPCHATVFQAHARVVELLYACERAREILDDPAIHVEAPRGTLITTTPSTTKGSSGRQTSSWRRSRTTSS